MQMQMQMTRPLSSSMRDNSEGADESARGTEDEEMEGEEDGDGDGAIGFDSVVKVYSTIQEPDYGNPWQTAGIESATGSGVAVRDAAGDLRILTAAHVVADQTFLQVQRTGVESPDKFVASVHAVRHECDLALLSVDSPEFWDGLNPARLGSVPRHRSLVLVAGFPVGGEELSITEGVVSRIEGQPYAHSRRNLLAVTVDAAINPGNSGGPAFDGRGDLIGIAFQGMESAENTGHVVPPPVIRHFMEGVAGPDGPSGYCGFPSAGVQWQELTNPYLRRHMRLDDDVKGVLITAVLHGNTCDGVLRKNDVLTRIDGKAVANNGTVSFGRYGRVNAAVAFTTFQCGETVELGIVREGEAETVSVVTKPYRRLVPLTQHDRRPPYFVYCGLVFQPLSLDYLDALGGYSAALADLLFSGKQSEDRRQAVVLSQTLSDSVNIGYEVLENKLIEKVNGESVRDLNDLVEKVEKMAKEKEGEGDQGGEGEPLLRFETADADVIIVPAPGSPDAREAHERILDRYKVGSDRFLPPPRTGC